MVWASGQVLIPENPGDDLSSKCGIDYRRLRDLLAAGEWKKADQETSDKMLAVIGKESWNIEKFPCTDLRTIDRLWVKYSNGRFGFSVQKRIFLRVGGQPSGVFDYHIYQKLADMLGWRKNGEWLSYQELTFSPKAPQGHLPAVGIRSSCCVYRDLDDREWWFGLLWWFFSRIETCEM
ncbi:MULTISPECIES: GUN4 domain-containing protein [unclassified Coleofasciculus]|uniref:GUN4 domain-containing protein n=1 Tax=unclassified Coleofasciculus TaxID=2692782 RepID=UPI001D1548BE|nr:MULTISPECIES: GUN4 domain-containing protein [unclassified Coleofasciculus]